VSSSVEPRASSSKEKAVPKDASREKPSSREGSRQHPDASKKRPSAANERGEFVFSVALTRSSTADKLGVDIKLEPSARPAWLRILEIKEGMVQTWNNQNPELVVRPDDVFVKVNEVSGNGQRMIKEFQNQACDFLMVEVARGREPTDDD
jgi:hypothetical protein